MKKITLSFLMVLVSYAINAQTINVSGMPDKPYKQTIDSLFSNINKTAVTSGVWYDRAYPMAAYINLIKYRADTTNIN